MARIYTKIGDGGETCLLGGAKIRKSHPRVAAYGTVDEANAAIGVAACAVVNADIEKVLRECQSKLFVVGGELAADAKGRELLSATVTNADTERLEKAIDAYSARLGEMTSFVVPGQSPQSAALHMARTVTRRAEREIVRLDDMEAVNPAILIYMNRLSDLLFIISRFVDEEFPL